MADTEFDIIIYATGFDAVRGAFDHIDFRGREGRSLKDKWTDGPRTFLGIQVEGFPNLFTIVGPHNAATFCNIPRCIEQNVEWIRRYQPLTVEEEESLLAQGRQIAEQWGPHFGPVNDSE